MSVEDGAKPGWASTHWGMGLRSEKGSISKSNVKGAEAGLESDLERQDGPRGKVGLTKKVKRKESSYSRRIQPGK